MAPPEESTNFDVIEGQKENIQSLPGGRSAKKLAEIYSPSPLHKLSTPTPSDTRNVNDCIRAEYEAEIQNISESDDPLDVFDRYVRWTLDAYPSAQATPQSQLHLLLERATKAFISSAQYKNDPRYLKMWIHYIHFFADDKRETFVFLSRHAIGERLALFYEEYAEWLESAGRWSQAEEVYKMGIEREALPVQRLLRKFKEFEDRLAQRPVDANEPSSPALPVRPALAAKTHPFTGGRSENPQEQRAPKASKPKSKMAIFCDTEAESQTPALSPRETGSKGWDTIGSMAERKKENTIEPKAWVGETIKSGKPKPQAAKMAVFRDPSLSQINNIVVVPSKSQTTVHPQTGKRERIFVDLATLYPTPEEAGTELSFEEVMAARRGWLDHTWGDEAFDVSLIAEPADVGDVDRVAKDVGTKLVIHRDDIHAPLDENGAPVQQSKPRGKKKKVMEVNETQIIKTKLDSPSGPKLKKRNTAEPTMTLHTRAATDDIYEIFNAPIQQPGEDELSVYDGDETDGDYTTDAESTGTTRHVDGETQEDEEDAKSVSEWSDFSRKHLMELGAQAGQDERDDTRVSDLIDVGASDENEDEGPTTGELNQQEIDPETPEDQLYGTRTSFIPVPPEDYDPPTRPYRDPAEVANNRLPFMTPITERTEVSLELEAERREHLYKTPCRREEALIELDDEDESSDLEPMSSPIRDIVSPPQPAPKISKALAPKPAVALTKSMKKAVPPRGPIIKDAQCNPVEESVRSEILANIQPPLSSYSGFFDHSSEKYKHGAEIRKVAKESARTSRGCDKDMPSAVELDLPDVATTYTVTRELGSGAFAPVYLVENSNPEEADNDENAVATMGKGAFAVNHRHSWEALKMEKPPTPWEFHMMRVAHSRLGPHHRAAASLSYAHELHLYQNEAFLFLPYHPHGTLLDVINLFRGESSGVMEEQLAMFFTIELLRTTEALHAKSVLHGDIKPDNCLLRLDGLVGDHHEHHRTEPLSSQWKSNGSDGWNSRGLTLIDFGRAIDMRNFAPDVQFIADWKTTAQDCAEMREGRPWTWQIDYHGLANTIHSLLFGKYIETIRCDQGGIGSLGSRRYRIRESLKRYWQAELWGDCFDVLLNPNSHVENEDGGKMPVLKSMRGVRERMERWLEENCERGVGLKAHVGRLEAFAKSRKH